MSANRRLIAVRTLLLSLCLCTSFVFAEKADVELKENGFIVVHSFYLTAGQICRKLDRHTAPFPAAWHLKPAWNAIYLEGGNKEKTEPGLYRPSPDGPCQRGISQRTLIGPLAKGKWEIYAEARTSVDRVLPFDQKEVLKKSGPDFIFTLPAPGILSVNLSHYHNSTGACREYVPTLIAIAPKPDSAGVTQIDVSVLPREKDLSHSGLCRAMPQTIANGAIELPAGSYKIPGQNFMNVTIYKTAPP